MLFAEVLSNWQREHGRLWSQERSFFKKLPTIERLQHLRRHEALRSIRDDEFARTVRRELRAAMLERAEFVARKRFASAHPPQRDVDGGSQSELDVEHVALLCGDEVGNGSVDEWNFIFDCVPDLAELRRLGPSGVVVFATERRARLLGAVESLKPAPLAVPTYSPFYTELAVRIPAREVSVLLSAWERTAGSDRAELTLVDRQTPALVEELRSHPATKIALHTNGSRLLFVPAPVGRRVVRALRARLVRRGERDDWIRTDRLLRHTITGRIGDVANVVEELVRARAQRVEADREAAEREFVAEWMERARRALDERPLHPPSLEEDWDRGVLPWWHYNR
jgi:hypothetical protein